MNADSSIFHPDFAVRPYWWEAAPPDPTVAPLPERVDVAIVGSGYCGLSAALELARSGASVAVLEAGDLGQGASSRNGGMVSGGLKLPAGLARHFGEERARRLAEDAAESFNHIEALIAREKLDADYVRTGRFVGAHAPVAYRTLKARAERLRTDSGYTTHLVPRDRQREEIGSDVYFGGMVVENSGALHPAKYNRALRHTAAKAGAGLYARAAVTAIERAPGGFLLQTARGRVNADTVLVATNGYTGPLTPYVRRRLIPVASYMIATEELPPELIRELSPKGRMLSDTKRVLSYFRLSPDGTRVLFGGRARFSESGERESAAILYGFMCRVWPQLQGYRLTHSWKGNVAFTFDHVPHMGEHDGIHYAAGCQGNGVAMMTYLGHQTALKLLGRQNRPCAFDSLPFPTKPFYSGQPWFLPIVGTYYRFRDMIDQIRAARGTSSH